VADTPGKPGTHPEAVPALAAAEAAEHCVQASVAAVGSKRSSGSQATSAALESSSLASAAVAAARTGRNRQRRRACLRSGGCLWATRSRLCRVLAGCPSLGCGCCEGGLGLESRLRVEVHWGTVLRRLAVVLACGLRRRAVVIGVGLGRLRE
jgi:hypothetical protein